MKLWIIRHKGKPTWGNYIGPMVEQETIYEGHCIWRGAFFFRKKDAIAFLKTKPNDYHDLYCIVSVEAT